MNSSRAHIAVVEDDPQMRALLNDFLISQGYSVTCFSSAMAALKVMTPESVSVDAIVADVVMPGLDGLELLKRMKKNHPETPLILITAFATEEGAMKATQFGAAAYFVKPFKLGLLASVITSQLKRRTD
jgi:DNA-binding NtrC family response regulator